MTLKFAKHNTQGVGMGGGEDPRTAMLEVEGIKIPMELDTGAVVPLNSKVAHTKKAISRQKSGGRRGTSQHIYTLKLFLW